MEVESQNLKPSIDSSQVGWWDSFKIVFKGAIIWYGIILVITGAIAIFAAMANVQPTY